MVTKMKLRPIPFGIRLSSAFRKFLDVITSIFFKLYYGKNGKKLPPIKDDILKQPAVEVARRIRNKEINCVEVINACIRRIKDTNSEINCLVDNRFELALEEAKEVDKIIQSGSKTIKELENEEPFLGVPFTTKDSIAVKGLHITAGVVLRKDVIADKDSDVVRLLTESGGIIKALTNVPELCMWWETHNHIYGRTNNPYDTTRIVGGSSGGEGCMQAIGGSCFGIGVGPLTRFAIDLKPILKVISGENRSKLNLDQSIDLKNLKIFYQINSGAPNTDEVDEDIENALKKVVEFFNKKYNIVSKEENIEWLQESSPIWFETMKSDQCFGEYIIENYSASAVYKEIFKNIIGCSGNTLIALLTILAGSEKLNPECENYKYYLKICKHLEEIFTSLLGDNGVFLYPTHPTPAPYHNQPLMKSMNFVYTAIFNSIGLPATAVPLGLSRDGLPIGIQVIANHNNDRLCLSVAEELEKAFGGWIEP